MSSFSTVSLTTIEKLEKHPNADSLDIVTVDGCPAIVRRGDFTEGEEVVVVPFDMVIPDSNEFDEVFRGRRVKPMRLRGIFSMSVVLKNKWGFKAGDDINTALGIIKYEPAGEKMVNLRTGKPFDDAPPPAGVLVGKYDLESLRKYKHLLEIGEEVVITEKIHGTNAKYVLTFDSSQGIILPAPTKLHAGSRSHWLKEENGGIYWDIARQYDLYNRLQQYRHLVIFGEIYGQVQKGFQYEVPKGECKFAAFDAYDARSGCFVDHNTFRVICHILDIPTTPLMYRGPWLGFDVHAPLAEGESFWGGNIREGFVIKPVAERYERSVGRVALKLHGQGYLLKKKD
jgi:RNA ligase (TIGR02306 family)